MPGTSASALRKFVLRLTSTILHHYWALNQHAVGRKFEESPWARKFPRAFPLGCSILQPAKGGTMPNPTPNVTPNVTKKTSMSGRTAVEADREELIRVRAYELYEARGGEDGHDVEDWLAAEAEIDGWSERSVA
jgi:hypothetical protein